MSSKLTLFCIIVEKFCLICNIETKDIIWNLDINVEIIGAMFFFILRKTPDLGIKVKWVLVQMAAEQLFFKP